MLWTTRTLSALLLASTAGCDLELGDHYEECGATRWDPDHDFRPEAGPARLRCDRHPGYCNLAVDSDIREPDYQRAVDVTFVGEGFTESELPRYRRRVAELIEGMRSDPDSIVSMAPDLFNFHRVDLPSLNGSLENADRHDSALGGCLRPDDPAFSDDWFLTADSVRVNTAIDSAPATDIEVILFNSSAGRANSGIHINMEDDHKTLTHELGHAFGLADEYSDSDACYSHEGHTYSSLEPLQLVPNLTTDPTGAKWAEHTDGARSGGKRYGCGVFHPTRHCRMLSSRHDSFCAVCRAHLETRLRLHRDSTANDGPPTCALEFDDDPAAAPRQLWIHHVVHDLNGATYELRIDGEPRSWSECAPAPCRGPTRSLGGSFYSLDPGNHAVELRCEDVLGESATDSTTLTVR